MVFPLNSLSSINLILICGQFLLFANRACTGIIAGVVVVYLGIEKKLHGQSSTLFYYCCLLFTKL